MKNLRISWSAGVFGMRTDDPYYTTVVGAANRIFAVDEWIHPVFLSETGSEATRTKAEICAHGAAGAARRLCKVFSIHCMKSDAGDV
jgi:hypothetical protein